MAIPIELDDRLLEEAMRLGQLRSREETVHEALREFIARRRRREVLSALGSIEFAEDPEPGPGGS